MTLRRSVPVLLIAAAGVASVAKASGFVDVLPDVLRADCGRDDLQAALRQVTGGPTEIIALCVAGRIRFPTDLDLPLQEGRALQALGVVQQARYRMKERLAPGGEDIRLH
jgi:hypothetical protein